MPPAAIQKLSPWTAVATTVVLTNVLVVRGVPFSVAAFSNAAVDVLYTVNGASATGRPIIAIELSRDPSTVNPAGITNWTPLQILNGASFATGTIDGYVEQYRPLPTTGVATTFRTRWPDVIDVSCHFWLRVLVADVDGVAPGTVTIHCGGAS